MPHSVTVSIFVPRLCPEILIDDHAIAITLPKTFDRSRGSEIDVLWVL